MSADSPVMVASSKPFLLVIIALACGPAMAQPSLGVRAGVSVSTLAEADAEKAGAIAPIVGAYAHFGLARGLAIRPEVAFTRRGGVVGGISAASTVLEAPVMVIVSLPPLANIRPNVQAGPVLGMSLVSREEAASADIGLAVGGEVVASLRGRGERFGVGIRYTMGLTPAQAAGGTDLRHTSLAVTGTFQF